MIAKQMILPYPRSYIDWKVPTDEAGIEVGVCTEVFSYRFYLEWLSDYLFEVDIPVPESQQDLLSYFRKLDVEYVVFDLSETLGQSIWDTESIQNNFARGLSFSLHNASEMRAWNELSIQQKEFWNEEEFFTPEIDYHRLGAEFREAQKIPSHINHADIPYRAILAALFKQIVDPKKRYDLLDDFYRNFDECVSK